jgi:hypothetical protein
MINLYPNLMHIYSNKFFNEKIDFNTISSSQFGTYLLLTFINTQIPKILYWTYQKQNETYKYI